MKNIIFGLLMVSVFLFGCISNEQSNNLENTIKSDELIDGDGEYVKIPLSEISSDMKKYSYSFEGVEIIYLVVLGSDGEVRTAFDACVVCADLNKGYRQEGEDVVCNNCGRHFSIDSLGEANKGGGCWPAYLEHEVEGDFTIIKKVDLENGKHLFG